MRLFYMCCFLPAEVRKKWKTFSHTHLGVWVLVCGGYRSHGPWDCSLFLLPFAWLPTHPPTLLVVGVFSCKLLLVFFHFMFVVKLLICSRFKLQQFSNYECYECTFSKLFFHWCSLWVGCRFFLFFPLSSLLFWFNCILHVV